MIPQTCTVPAGDYESYVDFREEITRAWAFFEPLDEEGLTVMHFVRSVYAPVEGGTFLIDGINYNVAASFPVYEHESEIEADEATGTMAVMASPEEVILSTDPLDVAMVENVNRYGIMPTSAGYENIETYANTSVVPWQINSDMNNKCKEVIFHDVVRPLTIANWFLNFFKLRNIENMAEYLDTAKVTTMSNAFAFNYSKGLTTFPVVTGVDISNFNIENVTNVSSMFRHAHLDALDLTKFKTNNITNFTSVFNGLITDDKTGWDAPEIDTSHATTLAGMFESCRNYGTQDDKIHTLDVSYFDTSECLLAYAMFNIGTGSQLTGGLSRIILPVNSFPKVTNTKKMFLDSPSLEAIENLNTMGGAEVRAADDMFCQCRSMVNIDISSMKFAETCTALDMFSVCSNLTTIITAPDTDLSINNSTRQMFYASENIIGGEGTQWTDVPGVDAKLGKYAKVDGGPDAPGFFTAK